MNQRPVEPGLLPEIEVHLIVGGSFDPGAISAEAGVRPSYAHRRGDRQVPGGPPAVSDVWAVVAHGPVATLDATSVVAAAFDTLEPVMPAVTRVVRDSGAEASLVVVARIRGHAGAYAPDLHFDHSLLRRLVAQGLSLEFDITVLHEDEG